MSEDARLFAFLLGKKLRALRKEKGLNQTQLAVCTDVSQKTLSRFERGEGLPDVIRLKKLAEALGTELGALIDLISAEAASIDDEQAFLQASK